MTSILGEGYRKKIRRIIRLVFPVAIIFFLARIISNQWSLLETYPWKIDYYFLSASFVFIFLTLFFVVVLWRYVMSQLKCELTFTTSFRIFHLSNLGRYVPGKVWQFVSMHYMLENKNIVLGKSASGIIWTNIFFNLSGLILGTATLFFTNHELHPATVYLLLTLSLAIIVSIQPALYKKILVSYLRRFNLDENSYLLSSLDIFKNIALYTGLWILYGSGFFLLTKSVFEVPLIFLPLFVGLFAIAHVIGYLSFLAPGGIGVREGILTYLLSYYMPLPVATIVSIMARLWLTVAEVVFALVALMIKK